ncbi:MAG: hypothetical protein ACREND_18965 [Gemmatimonadaceae bacterium]
MGSETRHITLRDGARSQVTVIARLVSDDTEAGQESACLVLRIDCAVSRRRPARVVTVRARSLHAVDEHALRRLAECGGAAGPTARAAMSPRQRVVTRR